MNSSLAPYRSNYNEEIGKIDLCISTILTSGRTHMYGAIFAFGVYCIDVIVVLRYLHLVSTHFAKKKPLKRREWILSIYVALAFILSTLCVAGSINQAAGDLDCDSRSDSIIATGFMFAVGFMFSAWAVDVIMIWRFLAVYYDFRLSKWIILGFSLFLLVGSIAFGMLQIIMFGMLPDIYLRVFEAFALSQNVLLTSLIVGRLLLFRFRIWMTLGTQHGSEYINVITMLVESQALLGVGQVALLATNSHLDLHSVVNNNVGDFPFSVIIYQIVGQLQVLSPVLLIYRVMQGKTYDSKTVVEMGTLRFSDSTDAREITA
ncbi:hypothetical protein BDQ17DRAFT_1358931 [Cyathus striatus]|nr:hypothetical protein BDQ17DRAFT_1358931 [Cyathus striatus]